MPLSRRKIRRLRTVLPIMFLPPHPVPHSEPRLPHTFTRVIDHHAGITHQPLDVRYQLRLGGTAEQPFVILPKVAASHHLPHELLPIACVRRGDQIVLRQTEHILALFNTHASKSCCRKPFASLTATAFTFLFSLAILLTVTIQSITSSSDGRFVSRPLIRFMPCQ